MMQIPYGRQEITDEDIKGVIDVLKSDYLTQGPKIAEFEKSFRNYVDAEFSVAVSNGTAALHLSMMALGVGPNHHIITTPITFAASANCIKYLAAEVTFCDIDPETYLIDLKALEHLLSKSRPGMYQGIITVDFTGRPVNQEKVSEIARQFGCWVLSDSCHSPGGYFVDSQGNKQLCGNNAYSDLTAFSFHPVKHIATGEGGMVTTNNQDYYSSLCQLRTHGITRDPDKFSNTINIAVGEDAAFFEEYPSWYMEMQELGYNYRLSDLQASLGITQLSNAPVRLLRRKQIAQNYFVELSQIPKVIGQSGVVDGHAYHLYVIEVEDRLGLYNYLRTKGVYCQVHYIPCHLMPYYQNFGWKQGDFPAAEKYYSRCLSLPMYPTLKESEQQYVIDCIKEYYK